MNVLPEICWELMHVSEEISKELGKTPGPCNRHLKSNSDRRGRGKIFILTEFKPQMPERSLRKDANCLDKIGSRFLSSVLWLHMWVYSLWKITYCIHIQILYFSMNHIVLLKTQIENEMPPETKISKDFFEEEYINHAEQHTVFRELLGP